jgi:hypothetical protein
MALAALPQSVAHIATLLTSQCARGQSLLWDVPVVASDADVRSLESWFMFRLLVLVHLYIVPHKQAFSNYIQPLHLQHKVRVEPVHQALACTPGEQAGLPCRPLCKVPESQSLSTFQHQNLVMHNWTSTPLRPLNGPSSIAISVNLASPATP